MVVNDNQAQCRIRDSVECDALRLTYIYILTTVRRLLRLAPLAWAQWSPVTHSQDTVLNQKNLHPPAHLSGILGNYG